VTREIGGMKVTTIVYSAILWTAATGFTPNAVRQISKIAPATVGQYPAPHRHTHCLHAWFQKDTPTTPSPTPLPVTLSPGPLDTKNAIALTVWLSLITYSFLFAPGELGAPSDTQMVITLASQPVPRPEGINELWFTVWNCFVPVPLFLAALTAPNGRGQRLPAAPFLFSSAFLGYFALGPYFASRTVRTEEDGVERGEMGWASRNVFESRAFGVVLTVLTLSIPVTSGLFAEGFDLGVAWEGFVDLASGSRFVAVASLDIAIMSLLGAVLVGEDCRRRGWEDKATLLSVGSVLFPVVGPSLYLAARPSLEE